MIIITDFYAEWCAPCKQLGKVLDQLKEENPEITIVKHDIDEASDLVESLGIRNIPYVIIDKDEETLYKGAGSLTKERIKEILCI